MAKARIVTGQYVALDQSVASVGDRIFAALIDYIVITLLWAMFFYVLVTLQRTISYEFVSVAVYLPLFLAWSYALLLETFNNGRTLGKLLLNIRVVSLDGTQPTFGQLFIRWLILPVEVMLAGVGVLSMLLSRRTQRIGDKAAGTIVIKNKQAWVHQVSINDFAFAPEYRPTYPEAAELSVKQSLVIYNTLMVNNSNRQYFIDTLAAKVATMLRSGEPRGSNEEFLRVMLNDYFYYTSSIQV